MPEGCECRSITQKLRNVIKGKQLLNMTLYRLKITETFEDLKRLYGVDIPQDQQVQMILSENILPFQKALYEKIPSITYVEAVNTIQHMYTSQTGCVLSKDQCDTMVRQYYSNLNIILQQEENILEMLRKSVSQNHKHLLTVWPQVSQYFPSVCLDVICRGKQIFFFFENGIVMNSGLGMEGHWYIDQLDKYTDFGFAFGSVMGNIHIQEVSIWYDDMMRYGNFRIISLDQAKSKLDEIGPDFLTVSHPWLDIDLKVRDCLVSTKFFISPTTDMFWAEISNPKRGNHPFCKFIMDQTIFSGVGNWIENEVAYAACISLLRLLSQITRPESDRIFNAIVQIMKAGYATGGLTHGTFLDPYHNKGTYVTTVYKREGQMCPRGYQIVRVKLPNGRSGFMVPSIQK
jgi:formamidopyrimidine-DNA glycosylase